MATKHIYCVLAKHNDMWINVIGSQGIKSYALGWFHALQSFYPRPAYQLVRFKPDSNLFNSEVVEESKAASEPKPCQTRN